MLSSTTIYSTILTIRRIALEQILQMSGKAVPLHPSWSESSSETLTTHWLLVLVLLIMWLVRHPRVSGEVSFHFIYMPKEDPPRPSQEMAEWIMDIDSKSKLIYRSIEVVSLSLKSSDLLFNTMQISSYIYYK